MTKTTPFDSAEFLGKKEDVRALVRYAADLETENDELKKEIERLSALIDRTTYGRE